MIPDPTGHPQDHADFDRALNTKYAIYSELSKKAGDLPVDAMSQERRNWVMMEMTTEEKAKLAALGDPRFWWGETSQLELDKHETERGKVFEDASGRLGHKGDTLSDFAYVTLLESRIEQGDEGSSFVPTPSGLSLEQEQLVLDGWSWDVKKECKSLAHMTRCAPNDLENWPKQAKERYRRDWDRIAHLMRTEYNRLLGEAAEHNRLAIQAASPTATTEDAEVVKSSTQADDASSKRMSCYLADAGTSHSERPNVHHHRSIRDRLARLGRLFCVTDDRQQAFRDQTLIQG